MGKVIKAVGSLFVTGVGSALGFAIGGPLGAKIGASLFGSVGASLLSSKPKAPRNSPANADRLRANIDVLAPRKTMIGISATEADIR